MGKETFKKAGEKAILDESAVNHLYNSPLYHIPLLLPRHLEGELL